MSDDKVPPLFSEYTIFIVLYCNVFSYHPTEEKLCPPSNSSSSHCYINQRCDNLHQSIQHSIHSATVFVPSRQKPRLLCAPQLLFSSTLHISFSSIFKFLRTGSELIVAVISKQTLYSNSSVMDHIALRNRFTVFHF